MKTQTREEVVEQLKQDREFYLYRARQNRGWGLEEQVKLNLDEARRVDEELARMGA